MEEKTNLSDQTEQTLPLPFESEPLVAEETPEQLPAKKKIWPVVLLLIVLAAAALIWLFFANRFELTVIPEGETQMLQEYGAAYQDPGARVVLSGRWLFARGICPEKAELQVQSDVQQDRLGKYTVSYRGEFLGWTAEAQREVRVVDTQCPEITLVTSDKTILPGQIYEEEGFQATDNYDGDITDRVHRTEEFGKITYAVMDSSGNPAYVEREIPYYDPLAPELVLEGGEQIAVACGTIYSDPGFSAVDNADGDITDLVAVEGEVLWYRPGTYEINYLISDTYGNVTQKQRRVEVTAQPRPEVKYPNGKVIYLTFDDGPGPFTGQLLDLLKYYGVKATFFVTDSGYDGTMWRIVNEGHSIGIHTMTHDYETIYASEEAFFQDLYGMQEIIYRNTGVRTTLMRFPGGGSNMVSSFNEGIMSTLTEAVQDAGFQYFDWNVDSNDAGGALKKKTVAANVIGGVENRRVSVVLQHDIHDFSVAAVEDIIVWGLNNGYTFLPLKETSPTFHHTVLN